MASHWPDARLLSGRNYSKMRLFLNPNPSVAASHSQRKTMKTAILTCLCSIALALPAFGQSPTAAPSPSVSSTAVASASAGANISPAATATPDDEDSIERSVSKKLKRHFSINTSPGVTVTRHSHNRDDFDVEDGALMAIPIIGIIFSTLFGAPVLIVAALSFFS